MISRLPAAARLKQLRLAILRIEKGRCVNAPGAKLSISTVAREAGVSPSLIHNSYPQIAEAIRVRLNRSSRMQKSAVHKKLAEAKLNNKKLREAISTLRGKLAMLASAYATVEGENQHLRSLLNKAQRAA